MLGLVYGSLGDTETSRAYLEKAFEVAYEAQLMREATDAMTNLAALMDDGDHEGAAGVRSGTARGADEGRRPWPCSRIADQGVPAPRQAISTAP